MAGRRAGRGFTLKPGRPLIRKTAAITTTTGLASIGVSTSSEASTYSTTTGLSPVDVQSISLASVIGAVKTTGLSSIGLYSSGKTIMITTTVGLSPFFIVSSGRTAFGTTGLAPINVESISHADYVFAYTTGLSPISVVANSTTFSYIDIESYTGEDSDVLIPIHLTGRLQPYLPAPVPPVDFAGIPDPTVAPTCVTSDTLIGNLPDGTYRYSYAAWKGYIGQMTAPSPWSEEVVLTTNDTVTLTYPAIVDADGYIVYRWKVI